MQFGLIEMWQAMGAVAKAVSILLIALSIVSLYFLIERSLTFRRAKSKSAQIAPKLADMLKNGQIKEALALASKTEIQGQPPGPRDRGRHHRVPRGQGSQPPLRRADRDRRPRLRTGHVDLRAGAEEGPEPPRHDRHLLPVHRPVRHDLGHHQRLPRHGPDRLGRHRRRRRAASPKPSSPRPSGSASPSSPCGATTS